jgi:hypothetical protein
MLMRKIKSMAGQWIGYYVLGPEYGSQYGQRAEFRFFLEDMGDGHFQGKGVDIEGAATDFDVSTITGLLNEDFISFKKVYLKQFYIDDDGTRITIENPPLTEIFYEGQYSYSTNSFVGTWQLESFIEERGDEIIRHVCTGKWELRKDQDD